MCTNLSVYTTQDQLSSSCFLVRVGMRWLTLSLHHKSLPSPLPPTTPTEKPSEAAVTRSCLEPFLNTRQSSGVIMFCGVKHWKVWDWKEPTDKWFNFFTYNGLYWGTADGLSDAAADRAVGCAFWGALVSLVTNFLASLHPPSSVSLCFFSHSGFFGLMPCQ